MSTTSPKEMFNMHPWIFRSGMAHYRELVDEIQVKPLSEAVGQKPSVPRFDVDNMHEAGGTLRQVFVVKNDGSILLEREEFKDIEGVKHVVVVDRQYKGSRPRLTLEPLHEPVKLVYWLCLYTG